jgi:hypothetical protein
MRVYGYHFGYQDSRRHGAPSRNGGVVRLRTGVTKNREGREYGEPAFALRLPPTLRLSGVPELIKSPAS